MQNPNYRGSIARRAQLQANLKRLEFLITNTVDPIAVGQLREDYRADKDELALYYDDILERQSDAN